MAVTESVLRSLRDVTHDAHVRINHHPFLSDLIRPGFSIRSYKRLLGAYFHIYEAIEREIDVFVQAHTTDLQYDSRRKLSWLRADLQYLNVGPSATPRCGTLSHGLAPIPDVGALIGTLYVIEGATLGGQVISRHLHRHLGLSASAGARFFNGYGDEATTQQQWQLFCQFADRTIETDTLLRSGQSAAVCVFKLIEANLDVLHQTHDTRELASQQETD